MRKIVKTLLILGLVLGVALAIGFWNANAIVGKFQPQLESLFSDSLKQQISLGKLSVNFFPRFAIESRNLQLEKPGSAEIGRLALETDLLGFFRGQVAIHSIALEDATFKAIRAEDGTFSFAGINLNKPRSTPAQEKALPETDGKDLTFSLQRFTFENVSLSGEDRTVPTPLAIELKNLNGSLSDIDLAGSARIDLTGTLLGTTTDNLQIKGTLGNPFAEKVTEATITFHDINLGQVGSLTKTYLPEFDSTALSGSISFDSTVKIDRNGPVLHTTVDGTTAEIKLGHTPLSISNLQGELTFDTDALTVKKLAVILAGQKFELTAKVSPLLAPQRQPMAAFALAADTISLDPLFQPFLPKQSLLSNSALQNFSATGTYSLSSKKGDIKINTEQIQLSGTTIQSLGLDLELAQSNITLRPSSVQVFGGKLGFRGALSFKEPKGFESIITGTNLDASQISSLVMKDKAYSLTGSVTSLSSRLQGVSSTMPQSLHGDFQTTIEKGSLRGVNILGQTLGAIRGIPGIGMTFTTMVPAQYADLLQGDETPFDTLTISTKINRGAANIDSLALVHSLYLLNANGTVGFNNTFDLRAQLRVTPLLSEKMVLKEPKLKLLLDQNSNLVIPVQISRQNGKTLFLPDTEDLVKRATTNTAKAAAGRALDRIAPGLGGASNVLDQLFK